MNVICGIDEAGRGPLAGPVTAAAVILPLGFDTGILDDSKKLSAKRRDRVEQQIISGCTAWALGWASPLQIDRINILQASLLAMRRAFLNLPKVQDQLIVLVDGNQIPDLPCECRAIVRGDATIPQIMAASILAKQARDKWMCRAAERYPLWEFERHKGYPTKRHRELCLDHGLSPIHRRSFTIRS